MTQVHNTQPYSTPTHSQTRHIQTQTTAAQPATVFGTLFFEVILSGNAAPVVPGWSLRLWPQARLGDATLEARPVADQTPNAPTLSTLGAALKDQGVSMLGPVRQHR